MKSTDALTAVAVVALAALPGLAMAQAASSDAALIAEGRRLFNEETFDGNGRTCASCHAAENNFTVDPAFLRTLPGNDPVFTAAPQLRGALSDLEVNNRLRQDALFCENVDGLDEICVLRSAPHTLALGTSRGRLGWSGDGSPDGTLLAFATGAVVQHATRTMARNPDDDFTPPTPDQLLALEAYQLSLGRQADPIIDPADEESLAFADPIVEEGRVLFHNAPGRNDTRSCAGCHAGGGANSRAGENRNFDTGVALLTSAPACLGGFEAPGDGGLGAEPVDESMTRRAVCGKGPNDGPKAALTFRGDGTFNTPPVIEAADTGPWFHNNAVGGQIEATVRFYTSDTFHASPTGEPFGGAFVLDDGQINAIGALLRALNAKMNVEDMALRYLTDALDTDDAAWAEEAVFLASVEIEDAIEVLTTGPVALFAGTDAVPLLREALELTRQAQAAGADGGLIEDAAAALEAARDEMVVE